MREHFDFQVKRGEGNDAGRSSVTTRNKDQQGNCIHRDPEIKREKSTSGKRKDGEKNRIS
jgi:hypothetical protein